MGPRPVGFVDMAKLLDPRSQLRSTRVHADQPRSSATGSLMGFYSLLLGGGASATAMMTDSAGAVRLRTVLISILLAAILYRTLRKMNRLPDGPSGLATGGLIGLVTGGAVASIVKFLGPAAIVPVMLAVLAFVVARWVLGCVRRAAAVIDQTRAEFAIPEWSPPETESSRPSQVAGHRDQQRPSPDPRDAEPHRR
jgi:hypothetical protein